MTEGMAETMRVLRPAPQIRAFYDGRIAGRRLHGPYENWLDDGGYTLGTCSYALVDRGDALVYDTHMSLDHARAIRAALEREGVSRIRVVLSHHHLDHIAGNAVFEDCEIWANAATAAEMAANREAAEQADPPISPVVMPSHVFDRDHTLTVGGLKVELKSYDIHSRDGLVLWLPDSRTLLAGDTLEDTVTYVAEPDRLGAHLAELDRMCALKPHFVLPNHGDPEVIAAGGFGIGLIGDTARYVRLLLSCLADPALAALELDALMDQHLKAMEVRYHPAYAPIHRRNVEAVLQTADA
ncbi:MAG: MBL fold metallo-hydrolase [Pseudomonadota bacterium]